MRLEFGSPSVHPTTGKVGARVQVNIQQEHGRNGHYEFDTHGMSQAEVAAKVTQLQDHHRKKAARLDGFAAVTGVTFMVNKRTFRVVDCTVWESAGEVELYIDAREITATGEIRVEGLPKTIRYYAIDAVPDNAAIMATILDAVQKRVTVDQAHASYVAGVKAMMVAAGQINVP